MAADVGGVDAAFPFHNRAQATFTTVVDTDNILGRLYNYKIIPNGLFVDEAGILIGRWIGFSVDRPECLAAVERFRAGSAEHFNHEPQGSVGAPGVAPGQEVHSPGWLPPMEQELYDTRIRYGAALKALGRDQEAAHEWRKALQMDLGNFVVRKQIWMLQHPERFHPVIDFEWQKAQLAKEQAEEATRRARNCGPDQCVISK